MHDSQPESDVVVSPPPPIGTITQPYLPIVPPKDTCFPAPAPVVIYDDDRCQGIEVSFPSPTVPRPAGQVLPLCLVGYLWIPKRSGPLPAVVFNHGSEKNPSDQSTNG